MSSLRLSDVVAKRNLKRVFWESFILIAFTLLGGTSYHLVVYKSLPGPRHVTPLTKTEAELNISLEISLEEALRHHTENSAIFIDARSYLDYEKGHIKGSLNISPQEPEAVIEEKLSAIPRDSLIITYCDGLTCDLSKTLAIQILMRGFDNVKVLLNGWSRWLAVNGPVESGA